MRQAMLATYFHGVDDALAAEVLSLDALPVLRRLLAEPDFPRRDNVVAFLAHLDRGESVPALLAYLEAPPAPLTIPEEDRALLLAPAALGHIAGRGSRAALSALLSMTEPANHGGVLARAARRGEKAEGLLNDLQEAALRGLAFSRAPEARERLSAIASGRIVLEAKVRPLAGSARDSLQLFDEITSGSTSGRRPDDSFPPLDRSSAGSPASLKGGTAPGLDSHGARGAPSGETAASGTASTETAASGDDLSRELAILASDTEARQVDAPLTFTNHPNAPNPMTASVLDIVLTEATKRAGRADFAGDVACCVSVTRSGPPATNPWTIGDGLDTIDTNAELTTILNSHVSRVKVVRAINYCGGPGTNIIGCAYVGGFGMAVVRYGGVGGEAVLWIHEYGHNVGLGHHADSRHIMFGQDTGSNSGMAQYECTNYHFPNGGSEMTPVDKGVCSDDDTDGVVDGIDNCLGTANFGQTDSDLDGAGDTCDVCPFDENNPDGDGDGACETNDNCPGLSNPGQENQDSDAFGDACDGCPLDALNDVEGDGVCANVDNCPNLSNPGQQNTDGDQLGNACDACPADATNDGDADGFCENTDNCPGLSNPSQADGDLDGIGNPCDADRDGDGFANGPDNCPGDRNPGQADRDEDGKGDACDQLITVDDGGAGQHEIIQAAIDAAVTGDIVLVRPGLYTENIVMKSGVDVVGAGADVTTINGSAHPGESVVTIWNLAEGVRLSGFTVTGGQILGAQPGGGVRVETTDVRLDGNVIKGNVGRFGGGIFFQGDPGFAGPGDAVITNNIITGNQSEVAGGAMVVYYGSSGTQVRHNTVSNNSSLGGAAGLLIGYSQGFPLFGNIISDNASQPDQGDGLYVFDAPALDVRENDVFNNLGGNYVGLPDQTGINGNLSVAPGFVSQGTGNYSLSPGSPLVDASSLLGDPPRDKTGAPRPLEGNGSPPARSDMGALERVPSDPDGDSVPNGTDNCPFASNTGQADGDLDGVGNACDSCPSFSNADQSDADGDRVGDPCDNCAVTPNTDQADSNSDGVGNACVPADVDGDGVPDGADCAPSNPSAFAIPSEVAGVLAAGAGATQVSWTGQSLAAGPGTVYDVSGGLLSELRADRSYARIGCLSPGQSSISWPDARPRPSAGNGYYYLVRAHNACGAGTYGQGNGSPDPRDPLDDPGTTPCP